MSSTSTPTHTSAESGRRLSLFQKATQIVYGPLPLPLSSPLSSATTCTWKPPTSPGSGGHLGRYLWTDAFGVLNFLTLWSLSSLSHGQNSIYLTLAKNLVQAVHTTLGRTRDQKSLLPNATDSEPLKGGLRIGKIDSQGPDCDGQYHHYLTLWMFALNRLSLATKEAEWNKLAIQLARAVHPFFVFQRPAGGGSGSGSSGSTTTRKNLKMVWKVSVDLKTVLVPSEGHLDAATGYLVYSLLKRTAEEFSRKKGEEVEGFNLLDDEINDYKEIMGREGKLHVSSDPLDLGMGLWMCHFFASRGREQQEHEGWARKMGEESLEVARRLLHENSPLMKRDASRRLAFREFGTCLGLRCYGMSGDEELTGEVKAVLKFWERYLNLDGSTEDFEDLRPISLVMFASALIPGAFRDGYLDNV